MQKQTSGVYYLVEPIYYATALLLPMNRLCYLLISSYIYLNAISANAQKETNIWYLDKTTTLDFNFQPPQLTTNASIKSSHGGSVPTIADKNGKLLFYSDGFNIYDRYANLMDNGEGIANLVNSSAVIVPKPQSNTIYYVFTTEGNGATGYNALKHATVDMSMNGGLGRVTQKNITLVPSYDIFTTVTGPCDRSVYWVVTNNFNEGLYAFKVDEHGVSSSPVITPFGNTNGIVYKKFSPNGDKIVFRAWVAGVLCLNIADFNYLTGEFTNHRVIPISFDNAFTWRVEFSNDGQVLYVTDANSIIQLDLSSDNAEQIAQSKKNIFSQGPGHWIGYPQLASNGKIYIRYDINYQPATYLGLINYPSRLGLTCDYQPHVITIGPAEYFMPAFVTSLLSKGVTPDAGKDTIVCLEKVSDWEQMATTIPVIVGFPTIF